MATKYEPLEAFLNKMPADVGKTTLPFDQIEQILGSLLPDSAYGWRPWWANQTDTSNRPQTAAWMAAGWKVELNQDDKWLRFQRR